MKPGDTIRLTDGRGSLYEAVITNALPDRCHFDIRSKTLVPPKKYSIHIGISPTKNPDRTEWFVEKAVEFGVDSITFLACKNTERSHLKTERLEKMAISAMKQSLQATLPQLNPLTKVHDVVKNCLHQGKFIAYVDQSNPIHLKEAATPGQSTLVLIGPEGDFTKEELEAAVQSGFKKVSLGQNRLRTETAGLAACHILNLVNSNKTT